MTIPEISRNGYEYIEFVRTDDGSKKTSVWECCNKNSGAVLGIVKWHGEWRQYSFFTMGVDAIFNSQCLFDIRHFLKQLKIARDAEREGKATAWLGDQYLGAVDQKQWEGVKK